MSSRSASPFETSIERSDPYVNKIRSSVETKAIKVPHEVQINRFRTGTATYKINIDPKLIAARGDQETPFVLSDLRQAREINASPERVSGWHNNIYPEAELTESWEKARRAQSTGGKLKDLEVMQLTQGCQRSATTVERVQHGILPAETKIEACYGGECWANWTMASKIGKFENMDVKNLKIVSPDAIEKWFAGKAGQQRVALMNKSPFIRQG